MRMPLCWVSYFPSLESSWACSLVCRVRSDFDRFAEQRCRFGTKVVARTRASFEIEVTEADQLFLDPSHQ
jgi:hypothetical protein